MTALAHRSTLRRPANGGVAARRAVVRWAWRMFRREWRQQILVIALLTVAVAAAIASVTIAYNSSPDRRCRARLGQPPDPVRRRRSAPAAGGSRRRRGTLRDDRRHRSPLAGRARRRRQGRVPRPGPARTIRGRTACAPPRQLPEGPGQVAVTDGVATHARARAREDACARRPPPDGRRHRREPTRSERRVRARLPLVRGSTGPGHGPGRRRRRIGRGLGRRLPGLAGR